MADMTAAASAICGTHFGETKLVASIAGRPASVSRSIRPTLTSVGTVPFSFCRPSRGPTSTMRTRRGSFIERSIAMLAIDHAGDRQSGFNTPYLGGDLLHGIFDQRDGRDVRRDDDAGMMPERVLRRQRLIPEHVERRTREMSGVEEREQVVVHHQRAARDVDEVRSGRKERKPRVVEEVAGL